MNCKQGELAIIVHSEASNEGKIVRCLQFAVKPISVRSGTYYFDAWRVDRELVGWGGRTTCWVPDSYLRPIRDPGDDAIDQFARPKHDETLKPKRQLEHC